MAWSARDVLKEKVRTIHPDASLADLDRALLEARVGGFPVVEGGRLVGVVSRSDVLRQLSVEQSLGEVVSDFYREHLGDSSPAASLSAQARELGRRLEGLRVRDVMMPGLISVAPGASLEEVARLLVENHIHRLPVVEEGRLVGIISSLDLVRLFAEGRAAGRS